MEVRYRRGGHRLRRRCVNPMPDWNSAVVNTGALGNFMGGYSIPLGPLQQLGQAANQPSPEYTQAQNKARELLRDKLTDAQKKCFDKHGYFFTLGASGKTYKVTQHGIYCTDKNKRVYLCVYPKENMPVYDRMLAQKLWLETNEQKVWDKANKREVDLERGL